MNSERELPEIEEQKRKMHEFGRKYGYSAIPQSMLNELNYLRRRASKKHKRHPTIFYGLNTVKG